VRALCAATSSRHPLLPALTRSLRAASVFLTSLPQRAKRARSGTLRLYYTSKQAVGKAEVKTSGAGPAPRAPQAARFPVSLRPPRPPQCQTGDGPPPMTRETAKTTVPATLMATESASASVPAAPVTGEGAQPPQSLGDAALTIPAETIVGPRNARHHGSTTVPTPSIHRLRSQGIAVTRRRERPQNTRAPPTSVVPTRPQGQDQPLTIASPGRRTFATHRG